MRPIPELISLVEKSKLNTAGMINLDKINDYEKYFKKEKLKVVQEAEKEIFR